MSISEQNSNSQPEQAVTPSAPSLTPVPNRADVGFFDVNNGGWIKSWRKTADHWLCNNAEYFRAWHLILYNVNWERDTKKIFIGGDLVECGRGQSVNSLKTWMELFGKSWTMRKVRTFLNLLKNDNMITIEGLRKTTRLTICNYDLYQDDRQANDNETTTRRQRDDNETTTTKEIKEIKERKKNNIAFDFSGFESLKECLEKWINYKAKKNQRYKDQESFNLLAKNLKEYSGGDPAVAMKIVERSMANNWAGIFKLSDNDNKGSDRPKPSGNFRTHVGEQDFSTWGKM